jgi:hypothetical protein
VTFQPRLKSCQAALQPAQPPPTITALLMAKGS